MFSRNLKCEDSWLGLETILRRDMGWEVEVKAADGTSAARLAVAAAAGHQCSRRCSSCALRNVSGAKRAPRIAHS